MQISLITSITRILFFAFLLTAVACGDRQKKEVTGLEVPMSNKKECIATLERHLNAIGERDLETLRSTLSPNGNMQLILSGMEIIDKVDGFMTYHRDWFETPGWTMRNTILNCEVGETMGMAVVEALYREAERDGKPYFNRLIVSYDLQKIDGRWYVIKDHASSVAKSTDVKSPAE